MLFAAIDYWQYKRKPGRFGNLGLGSPMMRSFRGALPESLVKELKPGDILFVQTLRSFLSWLIMYLTKSEISHVATYVGDRAIVHATSAGVVSEPIESLFSDNMLIVPCGIRIPREKQAELENFHRKHEGAPYSWRALLSKGARIVAGREPMYFRATFFADLAMVMLPMGRVLAGTRGLLAGIVILVAYAALVGVSATWAKFVPLPLDRKTAKPVEVLLIALELEGDFYLNPGVDRGV